MSRAWMPLYIGDYLADTGHLNAAENGAYMALIMHYWQRGSIPSDDELLRRITKMTHREWARSRSMVLSYFDDDGKHKRIDEELVRANQVSSVKRANALKSHDARRANALAKQSALHLHRARASQSQSQTEGTSVPSVSCASDKSSALVNAGVDPPLSEKKIQRSEKDEKILNQILDLWNPWAAAHGAQQVKFLTGTRARKLRQRLADIANGEGSVIAFGKVLEKCERSFFVRGNPRSPLKFDQLLQESFFVKLLENAFEFRKGSEWRK